MGCGGSTAPRSGLRVVRTTTWTPNDTRPKPRECTDALSLLGERDVPAEHPEQQHLAPCWRPDFSFHLDVALAMGIGGSPSRCVVRPSVELLDAASTQSCICGALAKVAPQAGPADHRMLIELQNERRHPKPDADKQLPWVTVDRVDSDNRFWFRRVLKGLEARLEPCTIHLKTDVELEVALVLEPDGSVAEVTMKPSGKTKRLPAALVSCARPVLQQLSFPCPRGNQSARVTVSLRMGHRKQRKGLF